MSLYKKHMLDKGLNHDNKFLLADDICWFTIGSNGVLFSGVRPSWSQKWKFQNLDEMTWNMCHIEEQVLLHLPVPYAFDFSFIPMCQTGPLRQWKNLRRNLRKVTVVAACGSVVPKMRENMVKCTGLHPNLWLRVPSMFTGWHG